MNKKASRQSHIAPMTLVSDHEHKRIVEFSLFEIQDGVNRGLVCGLVNCGFIYYCHMR